MEFITTSSNQTRQIAEILGQELKKQLTKSSQALVLALFGELGSGKTTFIQGLAKGLGIKEVVNSPSFILISEFKIPNSKFSFFHIDPYRLEKKTAAKELEKLGLGELIKNPGSVAAVEWADQIEEILPAERVNVTLEHLGESKRQLSIESGIGNRESGIGSIR